MFGFFKKPTIREVYNLIYGRHILEVESIFPENQTFRLLTQTDFDTLYDLIYDLIDDLEDRIDRLEDQKNPKKVVTGGTTKSFYPGQIVAVKTDKIEPVENHCFCTGTETCKICKPDPKADIKKLKVKSQTKNKRKVKLNEKQKAGLKQLGKLKTNKKKKVGK